MSLRLLLSAILAATVVVGSERADARLAGLNPFVPDTTLQRTDKTPPAAPVLRLGGVDRGRGSIHLSNGYSTITGEAEYGSIDLAVSPIGRDLSVVDDIGYCFHFMDGNAPDSLTLPAGAWSATHRLHLYIHWNDGETWDQDGFRFRMFVTAMDRAGNESRPSNVVVVEHNGNQEKEYTEAKHRAEQSARNDIALDLLSGTYTGTDSAGAGSAGTRNVRVVIDRYRVRFHYSDGSETAYMEVVDVVAHDDPEKLNYIDVNVAAGDYVGQRRLGVYRLDGGRLQLCLGPPGGERPKRLERTSRTTLLTLVRATTP